MRAEEGPMSPQMARLVHERLQAEVQALKVKFTLYFGAIRLAHRPRACRHLCLLRRHPSGTFFRVFGDSSVGHGVARSALAQEHRLPTSFNGERPAQVLGTRPATPGEQRQRRATHRKARTLGRTSPERPMH